MPKYKYRCSFCFEEEIETRPVACMHILYECPRCQQGLMEHVFEPTTNIFIPEAFHENAADILPTMPHEEAAWRDHAYKK